LVRKRFSNDNLLFNNDVYKNAHEITMLLVIWGMFFECLRNNPNLIPIIPSIFISHNYFILQKHYEEFHYLEVYMEQMYEMRKRMFERKEQPNPFKS
jgi:hypothetical protein